MSIGETLQLAQFVVTIGAAVLVWFYNRGESSAKLANRVEAIERRMEKAGDETSKLASSVQGQPERWRRDIIEMLAPVWRELEFLRSHAGK